jgi:hypothetical protein
MPDVVIAFLIGSALGFGIGYAVRELPFASECLVCATAAIASEAFIRIYCPNCGRCIRIFDFNQRLRRSRKPCLPR